MSDKDVEHGINIKTIFLKVAKTTDEALTLLTVAYAKHAMKK